MSDNEDDDITNTFKLTISTEQMITLVRSKPCLWNKFDLGYREKASRDRAWVDVYREVYPGYDGLKEKMKAKIGQQISKKWFNVRDAYVKSIRDPRGKRRPYIYSNILGFLDGVILGESAKQGDGQVFLDEQSFDEEPNESWLNESSFVDIDADPETPSKKPKLDVPAKDYLDVADNDNIVSILSKLINREEDEDRAFFTSIVPSVKSLSNNAKLEFKIKVLKLLKDVKKKDKNGKFVKVNESDSE